MTSAADFAHYAPRLQKRVSAKVITLPVSEDVMDQTDNISLDTYARQERFAQARRMPTDD